MRYFVNKTDSNKIIITDDNMIMWKWVWMKKFITLDNEGVGVINRTYVELPEEEAFLEML